MMFGDTRELTSTAKGCHVQPLFWVLSAVILQICANPSQASLWQALRHMSIRLPSQVQVMEEDHH